MSEPEAPWSAAWSGEQGFRLQPSTDFPGYLEVDQREARGVGRPLFALMHVNRQRRGIVDLICHVCGERTSEDDRYLFPTASGALVTMQDGSRQYGCNVPPMHLTCAQLAASTCPHLQKLMETPLKCPSETGRVVERTDVTPGMEALAQRLAPEVKVAFSCYRLYGPEFTKSVVSARERWERESRARRRPGKG